MATYIMLGNFTDQGIRAVKDTAKRAEALKDMSKKCGVTLKASYWTLGQFDVVAVFDSPDDTAMTALGFSLGALGNVRTQTLRAFSPEDISKVLGKLA
jgi:uncharacterized protein with GYD domain